MKDKTAARILTVVLATAGLSACSGKAVIEAAGGSGGATAGGGGGDAGVYDAPGDGVVSDAVPPPLECATVKDGQVLAPVGTVNGTTLTIDLTFGTYVPGVQAWSGTPTASADAALGTVDSVTVQGQNLSIKLTLAPGATTGTFTFNGDLSGFGPPPNYATITCPVARIFKVDLGDGGPPQIAEIGPSPRMPLDARPRMALALVSADGLRARVRAVGLSESAEVELDATGGSTQRDGAWVEWSLPPEPGLYQLEIVARDGGSIATSALAVEVKDEKA